MLLVNEDVSLSESVCVCDAVGVPLESEAEKVGENVQLWDGENVDDMVIDSLLVLETLPELLPEAVVVREIDDESVVVKDAEVVSDRVNVGEGLSVEVRVCEICDVLDFDRRESVDVEVKVCVVERVRVGERESLDDLVADCVCVGDEVIVLDAASVVELVSDSEADSVAVSDLVDEAVPDALTERLNVRDVDKETLCDTVKLMEEESVHDKEKECVRDTVGDEVSVIDLVWDTVVDFVEVHESVFEDVVLLVALKVGVLDCDSEAVSVFVELSVKLVLGVFELLLDKEEDPDALHVVDLESDVDQEIELVCVGVNDGLSVREVVTVGVLVVDAVDDVEIVDERDREWDR